MLRTIIAYLLAVAVAAVSAAVAQTQFVLCALQNAAPEMEIPWSLRLETTQHDIIGLTVGAVPSYGMVIAAGLLIAFPIAAIVRAFLGAPRWIAYPIAGAAAFAAILMWMEASFNGTMPIAGARGALGFAAQLGAGALGGLVFALVAGPRDE